MPLVVILVATALLAVTLIVFVRSDPDFASEPVAPFIRATDDGTWIMLLLVAVLFVAFAVLLTRGASPRVWFAALAASLLPIFVSYIPCSDRLYAALHSREFLDGDPVREIAILQRIYLLSLALTALLAVVAIYGYFNRQKT